jgi:hypothetical protein
VSVETLRAIHEAVLAHVRERNGDDGAVLDDWFVCYGGMVSDSNVPDGISHFSGYAVNDASTPQGSLGIATLGLSSLKENIMAPCTCPPESHE